jgi:hypothetical protein
VPNLVDMNDDMLDSDLLMLKFDVLNSISKWWWLQGLFSSRLYTGIFNDDTHCDWLAHFFVYGTFFWWICEKNIK